VKSTYDFKSYRIAIVHDWIIGMRGGERCLEHMLKLFPHANIYTLIHIPGRTSQLIDSKVVGTSFLSKLPKIEKYYRYLLPLFPLAAKQLSLKDYDVIISLSHAAVKNIVKPRQAIHVCYCFTPMRYIWDQRYVYFGKGAFFLAPILKTLQLWDKSSNKQIDSFVAISNFISERIREYYERESVVIYPPVATSWIDEEPPLFSKVFQKGEAFLYAGALVPYKRVDYIVEAFNRIQEPLWIVGKGPEEKKLRKLANSNIQFIGHVSDASLATYYKRCRALIFPATEDFGIIPVECMAAGRPVIALDRGGASETVKGIKFWEVQKPNCFDNNEYTGVFIKSSFDKTEPFQEKHCDIHLSLTDSLIESLKFFIKHEHQFLPESCRKQAQKFHPSIFYQGIEREVGRLIGESKMI
jgi:glycosyltransferase involved in cell wall biosynthesis